MRRVVTMSLLFALAAPGTYSQHRDPREVEREARARNERVKGRAVKVYYTNKFDLGGIPEYRPAQRVSGTIRQWGNNYIADSQLGRYWEDGFRKYHPDVRFEDNLKSSELGIAGLWTRQADLGHLGRQALRDELVAFQRVFHQEPLEIAICGGSFNIDGWTWAMAVVVHKDNPISKLTLRQLDGIFGAERTGGWRGLEWIESVARGPEHNVRTWGQLGLTGQWRDKTISTYGFPLRWNHPIAFANKVFNGGYKWNENLREYMHKTEADGTWHHAGARMMADLSKDPYGIAYININHLTPQTKPVAIAAQDGGPYADFTIESVQKRTYPLFRDIYVYLYREPGKPIEPRLKEFLRYILSREGQEAVNRDGHYLPLTAAAVDEQLRKLE